MPELLLIMFFPVAPGLWQTSGAPFAGTVEECREEAQTITDTHQYAFAVCQIVKATREPEGEPT